MFKRLRRQPVSEVSFSTRRGQTLPTPDEALAVVGDIHGQIRCLDDILEKLATQAPRARWIFVGDVIDRGDHSADVLSRLREVEAERPDTICLRGNHEDMMLKFLRAPEEAGNRWMRHGGLQTMASFGAFQLGVQNSGEALRLARDQLLERLPDGLVEWLSVRPYWFQSGNVAVVHAGADPEKPIAEQDPQSLMWGHRGFRRQMRPDRVWVVHGHTIVDMPEERSRVISIDTGAYATGRLTAALITDGHVEFVQTAP
ncbi:metallophosphoesterase family protein [Celeribacter sp. PS-C1]|uniref:metallophosphoesterase family protein n=1 Tax=Celeribacter sp. PS-C1 TaxID=2820813 RepID=UPI001C66CB7C|nr:metallophosphoesterase family protein [Celeribacter sp. PS-C1]MBW6417893.1 serine/threonine protein phosphatase [Celeribacter sp. PS-C1]